MKKKIDEKKEIDDFVNCSLFSVIHCSWMDWSLWNLLLIFDSVIIYLIVIVVRSIGSSCAPNKKKHKKLIYPGAHWNTDEVQR